MIEKRKWTKEEFRQGYRNDQATSAFIMLVCFVGCGILILLAILTGG